MKKRQVIVDFAVLVLLLLLFATAAEQINVVGELWVAGIATVAYAGHLLMKYVLKL